MFKNIKIFLFLIVAVFSLAACGPDTSTPEGIKEAMLATSDNIRKVDMVTTAQGAKSWVVFYDFTGSVDPVFMAGDEIMRATKDMINDKLIMPGDDITYIVHVDTVDKFGNKGTDVAMKLTWTGDNLNKINWNNMNSWDFTNLAESVIIRPIFYNEFVEFLKKPEHRKNNQEFIKRAVIDSGLQKLMN